MRRSLSSSDKFIYSNHKIRGFTLIEMVMAIVLMAIIAGMVAPFIKASVDGYFDTRTRSALTAKGQLLLERLNREIREANPDPGKIIITGSNKLQFTQLAQLNGLQNVGGTLKKIYNACRTVIVSQSGNSLLWDENADGAADATLAGNVSNITFTYSPGTTLRSGVLTIDLTLADGGESVQFYREVHIVNTQGTTICSP